MKDGFEALKEDPERRAAILKVEDYGKTHPSTIKSYLKEKYKLEIGLSPKELTIAKKTPRRWNSSQNTSPKVYKTLWKHDDQHEA